MIPMTRNLSSEKRIIPRVKPGVLNRGLNPVRGFKSLPLRQIFRIIKKSRPKLGGFSLFSTCLASSESRVDLIVDLPFPRKYFRYPRMRPVSSPTRLHRPIAPMPRGKHGEGHALLFTIAASGNSEMNRSRTSRRAPS